MEAIRKNGLKAVIVGDSKGIGGQQHSLKFSF